MASVATAMDTKRYPTSGSKIVGSRATGGLSGLSANKPSTPGFNPNFLNSGVNKTGAKVKTTTPTSSGGSRSSGGSSGGGGYTEAASSYDPRQGLIDYYKQQNETARKSALDAIEARLKTQLGLYENQFAGLNDNYDALINQAEVNYYKSRGRMREALSNRGQLDSGLGRQENLNLNIARGNELSNINRQRQKAHDDYNNSIASLKAEAEADKATINNQYATELRNAIAQIMAQYA